MGFQQCASNQASSSRAAERLASGGAISFVGFDALAGEGGGDVGYIPPSSVAENSDATVLHPEAAMLVSKLSKRDATTKFKALKGLEELINSDTSIALDVSRHWPRIYKRLSLDVDRRVRIQTQDVLGIIGKQAGKKLSSVLKQIIGPWMSAQFDPSRDVASHAKVSFNDIFPTEEKRAKVFKLCLEPLVEHQRNMIETQTIDSLADAQAVELNQHEKSELYERAFSSAVYALASIMKNIAGSDDSAASSSVQDLLSASKLWKTSSKTQSQIIKQSIYELVSATARYSPKFLQPVLKKVTVAVFGGIVGKNPNTVRSAWNASLSLVKFLPECWSSVDPRKAIWPNVWTMLKNGGFGNSDAVLGSIPPFINLVPLEIIGDGCAFHSAMLTALWEGLTEIRSTDNAKSKVYTHVAMTALALCRRLTDGSTGDDSSDSSDALNYIIEFMILSSCYATTWNDLDACVEPLKIMSKSTTLRKCFWDKVNTFSNACMSQWKFSSTFPDSQTALPKSEETELDVSIVTAWLEKVVSQSVDEGSEEVLQLTADIVKNCFDTLTTAAEPTEPKIKFVASLLSQIPSLSIFGQGSDVVTLLNELMNARLIPLVESSQKSQSTLENSISESTVIACCVSTVRVASFSGASSNDISELMRMVLDVCLSVSGLTSFLDLTSSLEFANDEWKDDNLAVTITDKCVEVAQALERETSSDTQLQCLQLLTVPLSSGVYQNFIDLAQHRKILSILTSALSQTQSVLSRKSVQCVQSFFPGIHEQGAEFKDCVRLISKLLVHECKSKHDIHESASAEALRKIFNASEIDEEDIREGVSLLAEEIESLVHGQSNILKKINESTILAEYVKSIGAIIGSILNVTHFQNSCVHAAFPDIRTIKELRKKFFTTTPFDSGYLIERQIDCSAGWLMGNPSQHIVGGTERSAMLEWFALILYVLSLMDVIKESQLTDSASEQCGIFLAEILKIHAVLPSAKSVFQNVSGGQKLSIEVERYMETFISTAAALMTNEIISTSCWKQFSDSLTSDFELDMNFASATHVLASLLDDIKFYENLYESINGKESNEGRHASLLLQYLLMENSVPSRYVEVLAKVTTENPFLTAADVPKFAINTLSILAFHQKAQSEALKLKPPEKPMSYSQMTDADRRANAIEARLTRFDGSGQSTSILSMAKTVLKILQNLEESGEPGLTVNLSDTDSFSNDELQLAQSISISAAKIFQVLIEGSSYELNSEDWDFILCTTLAWLEIDMVSVADQAIVASAARITAKVHEKFASVKQSQINGVGPKANSPILATIAEWMDFFVPAMGEQLVTTFIQEKHVMMPLKIKIAETIYLVERDVSVAHADMDKVVDLFLSTPSTEVALGCHHLILHHIEEFGETDEDIESRGQLPNKICDVVEKISARVEHSTDLWKLCLAILLFCKLFEKATITGKAVLAARIRRAKAISILLNQCAESIADFRTKSELFDHLLTPSFTFCRNIILERSSDFEDRIIVLQCYTFYRLVSIIPVLARDWYQDLGRRVSSEAAVFTSKYLSPKLIDAELRIARANASKDENLNIVVRSKANEVVGVYSMDDMSMELVISFNESHPLQPVTVTCGRRVGVPAAQWRNWLLQMTTFMSNQNGSILDGFKIWRKNVDKRFEGLEDCTICYAVIHPVNYCLPDKKCKTCKNSFHSACLFKWFNTSQQSTCPLCRNLWMN